uniref:J domain-containing protein n=1 Tax=Meloidogyne javanica TaxID=6303 RepID=A0A915MZ87_MELJA
MTGKHSTPTHYETLNVPQNASTEKIKANYRELMMKYHPDKNKNDPKAKEIAQKLNEAHRILTDEQERTKYDKSLPTSSGSSHTTSGGSSTTSRGSSATNRGSNTTSARPSSTHGRPAATPEKSATTSKR